VTPIVFEKTGATQWKVVSIGTSRTNTGSGVQTHAFAPIAGITSLDPAKLYTVGFTHRGYTGTGANLVADAGYGGIVDFTGYNVFTDRWAYASGTMALGTLLGTGGLTLDASGFAGRIYSASFQTNATAGWTNYCTAGTSTNLCTPSIVAVGSPSVSQSSGFSLRVLNLEGQKQGLIFYGLSGSAISPWSPTSTSFLCVKAPTQRMTLAPSGGTLNQCNGTFSTDWLQFLASNPSALGAPIGAGTTVHAQAWYRDPPAPKTTNLSNAIQFRRCPESSKNDLRALRMSCAVAGGTRTSGREYLHGPERHALSVRGRRARGASRWQAMQVSRRPSAVISPEGATVA
jgi:hypothetical protein